MNPKNQPAPVENFFLVPIIVMGFIMQGHTHSGRHTTPAAAIFDLSVFSICLIGYIVALVVRLTRKQQSPALMNTAYNNPFTPNPQNVLMAIPYKSLKSDQWRCVFYSTLRTPGGLFFLFGMPLLVGFGIAGSNHGFSSIATLTSGLENTAVVVIVLALLTIASINALYPSGSPIRSSTVALSADGFHDMMPSKTAFIPWSKVRSVVASGPDVYFFTKSGCNYFPCVMTNTPNEGRLLIETATELWKGRPVTGSNLPVILPAPPPTFNPMAPPGWQPPQNPGTWPPPPSPGWQQQPQWPQQPPQQAPWQPQPPQQNPWPPQSQQPPQSGQWPPQPPAA